MLSSRWHEEVVLTSHSLCLSQKRPGKGTLPLVSGVRIVTGDYLLPTKELDTVEARKGLGPESYGALKRLPYGERL